MTPLRFAITSPHQDVKRTYTSKLSIMHGVQVKGLREFPRRPFDAAVMLCSYADAVRAGFEPQSP